MLWLWDCYVNPRRWLDPRSFIAAPTRDQVKSIYWNDIKALVPPAWIRTISETNLSIITKWNAELRLVGLDKPQRLEGTAWDEGAIDELADCKPGIWGANIRPAVADRKGGIDLLGVPDMHGPSQSEYQNMCDRGASGNDAEWADFAWGSAGILDAEEIESMRSSMDPRVFEQETTGKFILAGGRAFPDFDPKVHVRDDVTAYDPMLPLRWSLDFNIDPMCSGVLQIHKNEARVIDELTLPDTKTDAAFDAFIDLAHRNKWDLERGVMVYGDATGAARDSTSGVSDWNILHNRFRVYKNVKFYVPRSNPPVKDTINAVNGKIKNAAGEVTLYVSPKCKQLINDLRSALWPGDLEPYHAVSWLRYIMHTEFPVAAYMPPATGSIGFSS